MYRRGTKRRVEQTLAAGDTHAQCQCNDSTRWCQPRSDAETAARLDVLCRWTQAWLDKPDSDKRLAPADVAALQLLARDLGIHAPCNDIDMSANILRAYLLFWRALHGMAVRQGGFVPSGPWPLTASVVCESLHASGVIETVPLSMRVTHAHNLAELFFASRRCDRQLVYGDMASRRDAHTRIAVGTYADGSRQFVVCNKHMVLTAANHADLDDGLVESERALGYSELLRWIETVAAVDLAGLAGLAAVATHHDICPQAAAALHTCALQRHTLLVSQVYGVFSQSDLSALRTATPRLLCLLDRLRASPRDLQTAAALTVARSCVCLAEPEVRARLCREMLGLVVAARLLLVEPVADHNPQDLMCDAARALGLTYGHVSHQQQQQRQRRRRGRRQEWSGIDVALALAAL
nr:hypothetical protein [Pandoravirus massiliensis]